MRNQERSGPANAVCEVMKLPRGVRFFLLFVWVYFPALLLDFSFMAHRALGADVATTHNAPLIKPEAESSGPEVSMPNKQKKLFEGLEFSPYGSNEKRRPEENPKLPKEGTGPLKPQSGGNSEASSAPKRASPLPAAKKRIPWELEELPKTPSQPAILGAESEPVNYFNCGRKFQYRGKDIPCDSYIRQDGRGLNELFSKVPEAKSHLESYQSSWRNLKPYAYVGALGLGMALTSMFLPKESDGKGGEKRSQLSTSMMWGGLGLFGATLTVGFTHMAIREKHLTRAVEAYNLANPADPVTMSVQVEVEL